MTSVTKLHHITRILKESIVEVFKTFIVFATVGAKVIHYHYRPGSFFPIIESIYYTSQDFVIRWSPSGILFGPQILNDVVLTSPQEKVERANSHIESSLAISISERRHKRRFI